MSEQKISLALSFMKTHPDMAAKIMEQQRVDELLDFVTEAPLEYLVPVIGRMLPQYVGRLCKKLGTEAAAGLLARLDVSFVAAVLRYLGRTGRENLLREIPTKKRLACKLLLDFSEDTVGAWLSQDVVTIPCECSIGEALDYVKAAGAKLRSDYLFVVDRERRLQGRISYFELLQANPEIPLIQVMEKYSQGVAARLSLVKAAEHKEWKQVDVLPVHNRSQQFIGVLRHVNLRKGLNQLSASIDKPNAMDPISGILDVYGHSLLALLHSMGDVLESDIQK